MDLCQIHAEVMIVRDAREIRLGEVCLEDVCLEVGPVASDAAHGVVKGHRATGAMDPGDGSAGLALRHGCQDSHHGRDADAGGDEDNGHVGGVGHVEVELASGVGQLDDVADLARVDEQVGDDAGVEQAAAEHAAGAAQGEALVALDGDAVVVGPRGVAERVLAGLEAALVVDVEAQRDVLARLEAGETTAAVLGDEVKGPDVVAGALVDLLVDAEAAVALPLLKVAVQLGLAANEHLGQHPVGLCPGVAHLGGHDGAEDLGEGVDEVLFHDAVVLRQDPQRAVLVAHALHLGDELGDVADVVGVAEDHRRERPRLPPVGLVDRVEVVVELRVVPEHVAVEDGRDALAVIGERWDGSLDQLGLVI